MYKLPDSFPTPEEARKKLLKTHIELPLGSYFRWIEPAWFSRYKEVLSEREGMWIPRSDKINELMALDKTYDAYKEQQHKRAYAKKMELKALSEAEGEQNGNDIQQETNKV
jgi:hypothetical protein